MASNRLNLSPEGFSIPDVSQKVYSTFEEIGIPPEDFGKSFQFSRNLISDPSEIVREINVPEVFDPKAEFVYNFYLKDERVSPPAVTDLPLDKTSRYVLMSWKLPTVSEFLVENSTELKNQSGANLSLSSNAEKIVSEDDFFNPGYVSHTFSNVDLIEQGASDLENYSRISRHDAESVFGMTKYQIREITDTQVDDTFARYMNDVAAAYSTLADFPTTSLGLRIFDKEGNPSDKDDLFASISKSLSLNVKINGTVVPDIFCESRVKSDTNNLERLKVSYANSLRIVRSENLQISAVQNDCGKTTSLNLTQPVKLVGYVIDRFIVTTEGIKKDASFYVEDVQKTQYVDRTPLYGVTYIYSIRVVASVKILSYDASGVIVDVSTIYVSSRPTSLPIECFEYTPPPEPDNIRFTFDYVKRNLTIHWDTPVNPQKDIKQFQVFRRKSIKEPFELIAQYGFDRSIAGPGGSRYKTGERVDANNYVSMNPDDKYLVIDTNPGQENEKPVYMHVDEDFTVDPEFFVSSEYIYALAAVDAHGMISNYSSQHYVTFDPYKNRLMSKVICDAGSPRQYPNMNLKMDAFKDVISVSGDASRQLKVYFTPEYLKVRDDSKPTPRITKIIEGQNQNNDSYYLLQLINLDNQKVQMLKINVRDTKGLTT